MKNLSNVEKVKNAIRGQLSVLDYGIDRAIQILYDNNPHQTSEDKAFFDELKEKYSKFKDSVEGIIK